MIYRNLHPTVFAFVSLIWAPEASALLVEYPAGNAVLGSPIEFSLRASLAPGEDASTLCIQADVSQADVLVTPSKVRVQLLSGNEVSQATIRISSAVIVDEPVLNIVIRYGCAQKSIRKFIVFADPPNFTPFKNTPAGVKPPEVQNSSTKTQDLGRLSSNNFAALSAVDNAAISKTRPASRDAKISTERATGGADRSASATSLRVDKPLMQSQRLGTKTPSKAPTARLQIDVAGSAIDPTTKLRLSSTLVTLPLQNTLQRAEAAALWRVLGSAPEELQQDLMRLQALQGEMLVLKNVSTQGQVEKRLPAAQLKTIDDPYYKNLLLYTLAALLALAILALLRVYSSTRNISPTWWKARREISETDDVAPVVVTNDTPFKRAPTRNEAPAVAFAVAMAKTDTKVLDRKNQEMVLRGPSARPNESVFASLAYQGNTRDVSVEEIFDIQQQADFFISLGQHDQAIEVLKNHIGENVQTSPLIYLDLLSLYHSKARNIDYQELAKEFTRLFNGVVPPFEIFDEKTQGLESYPLLLRHIESLWHTDNAIDVIENLVFRNDNRVNETLDLEAYRELLLLHSLAKDFAENERATSNLGFLSTKSNSDADILETLSFVDLPSAVQPAVSRPQFSKLDPSNAESIGAENQSSSSQKSVGVRIGLDVDLSTPAQRLSGAGVLSKQPTYRNLSKTNDDESISYAGPIEFDLDVLNTEIGKIKRTDTSQS